MGPNSWVAVPPRLPEASCYYSVETGYNRAQPSKKARGSLTANKLTRSQEFRGSCRGRTLGVPSLWNKEFRRHSKSNAAVRQNPGTSGSAVMLRTRFQLQLFGSLCQLLWQRIADLHRSLVNDRFLTLRA